MKFICKYLILISALILSSCHSYQRNDGHRIFYIENNQAEWSAFRINDYVEFRAELSKNNFHKEDTIQIEIEFHNISDTTVRILPYGIFGIILGRATDFTSLTYDRPPHKIRERVNWQKSVTLRPSEKYAVELSHVFSDQYYFLRNQNYRLLINYHNNILRVDDIYFLAGTLVSKNSIEFEILE